MIAEEWSKWKGEGSDLAEKLQTAFLFSTLTKAMSKMSGVETGEGGLGSMIKRRRILLTVLKGFGDLNTKKYSQKQQERKLSKIGDKINGLIQTSHERARERTEKILHEGNMVTLIDNPDLDDPESTTSIEARKYAAILLLNELEGLDMVPHLNSLKEDARFPTENELRNRFPYINDCLNEVDPFFQRVLTITSE